MEMDDERLTGDNLKPSYWLDACEDICDVLIPPPAEFIQQGDLQDDSLLDPCFFDGILDSIPQNANNITMSSQDTVPDGDTGNNSVKQEPNNQTQVENKISDHNGFHKVQGCYDNQERFGTTRHLKERPPPCRKRPRDHEEKDHRRDRSSIRRKEQHHSSNGRRGGNRDMDWREGRGYWERDRLGTNDMVFRQGSWEAGCNKDIKPPVEKNNIQGELKTEDDSKKKMPKEQARKYQLDVLEQARNKNTIAFLETGAGKTLIAVLLIKSLCIDLHKQGKKMLAVFLVPKVPLVYQQAEVIRDQTGYQVGHYCGEMGQDFWDARRWQREFEKKQVLVMTAQILLNILRHSIIKMEAINLLILDECHHAVKKHPYSLVMSEFYHTTTKEKRPSVFGMTASPVNLKGVSSQVDCAIKIRNLETKLDSVVCTIKDRKELEKHVPMPIETVVEYDKAASLWSLHEQIKQMEVAVEQAAQSSSRRSKWQFMGARDAGAKEELRQVYGVSERTEGDGAANLIQKLRAINYALGELGQWCAYKVAQSFLTALQSDERANFQLDIKFQESYLSKVVSLLQCQLSEGAVLQNDIKREVDEMPTCLDEIEEGELPDSHGEYIITGGVTSSSSPSDYSVLKRLIVAR